MTLLLLHLDDSGRIVFGCQVYGRLSIAVFDVSLSLALLQQLSHTHRVPPLTRQMQGRLT